MRISRELIIVTVATLTTFGVGCAKKKVAAATPPPPPPAVQTPAPRQQPTSTPARPNTPAPAAAATQRSNMPDEATKRRIDTLLEHIEDAYFDYDKHTLRPDAIEALRKDSTELRDILKDYPQYKLTIEGHADERGSAEYNMALGQARAEAAKNYLVQVGIPGAQFNVVSYGKEKPVCTEQNESCWQKNRRIHFVAMAR